MHLMTRYRKLRIDVPRVQVNRFHCIHGTLLAETPYTLPNMTDFRDTLFSFDVPKAKAGALSAYAILVVQQCQQTVDDLLLFSAGTAERDGRYCTNVRVRIIQQFEQSIHNSW